MGLVLKTDKIFNFKEYDYKDVYCKVYTIPVNVDMELQISWSIFANKTASDDKKGLITTFSKELTQAQYEQFFTETKADFITELNSVYPDPDDIVDFLGILKSKAYSFIMSEDIGDFIAADWESDEV